MHTYTVKRINKQTGQVDRYVFKNEDRHKAMFRAHAHLALLEEMTDFGGQNYTFDIVDSSRPTEKIPEIM
jgi:hypothetical protein